MNKNKVVFNRPTKFIYICRIFRTLFSISFIKHLLYHFSYYLINYSRGRRIAQVGENTKLHPTVILREPERIFIGKNCLINHNNVFQAGKCTGKIVIGDFVQTGANVMMFAFNHGTEFNNQPMINQDYFDADILIGDDVWIGAGSVILPGVTIGRGAVIASNAVVNKDVKEFSIVGGVPARHLKMRKLNEDCSHS